MAPIRTNVFLPGLVRHVLGRFCVLLLGPLVLVVWASQVQEKTYNLVVDGFVGCVLAAHVGRFVWEVVLSQCCALKSLRGSAGSELLRVVTFNVNKCARAGEGWDLNIVVDAVTRNGRPHIVALQNVHHDDSVRAVNSGSVCTCCLWHSVSNSPFAPPVVDTGWG